jgi:hypothetical protein
MSKPVMTKEQVQDWMTAMDCAHAEILILFQCTAWALESHKSIWAQAFGEGNVIDFASMKPRAPNIKPWPDAEGRNFQQIGKDLDYFFHLVNKLLPEVPETKDGA